MHYVLIRHMSIEHWYDVKTVENNFLAAVNSFFLLFFVKTVESIMGHRIFHFYLSHCFIALIVDFFIKMFVCVCVCVGGGLVSNFHDFSYFFKLLAGRILSPVNTVSS